MKREEHMKKSIISLCLILLALTLAIATNSTQAKAVPEVSVDPSNLQLRTAYIGQTIQVNVNISDVTGLWGWEIKDIRFSPKVLTLTNVQEGPFLQKGGQTFFLWTSSSQQAFSKGDIPDIDDALTSYTGVSGSGVLVTLTFQVISQGNSPITLTTLSLLNSTEITPNIDYDTGYMGQINCTVTNGSVDIGVLNTSTSVPIVTVPPYAPSSSILSSNPTTTSFPTALYVGIGVVILIAILVTIVATRRRKPTRRKHR
jgi:hypothetical protein